VIDRLKEPRVKRAARNLAIGGAIFAVVMIIAFRYLAIYHKSLVWVPDGAAQHFPSVYYLNELLRQFIRNPSQGFPFWSWQLGFGADTINTLSFYAIGDPFVPISFVFPMRSMELAFAVIYFVRIACAGLFCALFLRKMGARPFAALVGSLVYAFTTFTLFYSVHHPIFGTALALFPLLLLGAEYALEHRRCWLLVLVVFLSAAGNFYFFYMELLTLIVYVVARYFEITPRVQRWRRLLPEAFRIAGCVVLGMVLAGPVFFPSIAAVFTTARRQVPFVAPLFLSVPELGHNIVALVSTSSGVNYTVLGFAPLAFVLIPALFMRRGNMALKVMLVAFPVALSSPILSAAFNGFTFPSGRYGFQWALFVGLAVALMLSDDRPFSGREIVGMLAGYLVLWALVFSLALKVAVPLTTPFVIGLLTWAVFAFEWARARHSEPDSRDADADQPARDWSVPATRWVVLLVLIAGVFAASGFTHARRYGDSLHVNLGAGKVLLEYQKSSGMSAAAIRDGSFYRVQNSNPLHYNDALIQGVRSTSFYFSIMNGNLTKFLVDNEVRPGWSSFSIDGLDDRAALDAITAVKYYTTSELQSAYAPYGYRFLDKTEQGLVYRNDFALPLGFVYDGVISRSEFEALPVVARQQAMLQGAVVDDVASTGLPSIVPSVAVIDVPYSVAATEGAVVDLAHGRIFRPAGIGRVKLRFESPANSELYVQIAGFDNLASSPMERAPYLYGGSMTPSQTAEVAAAQRRYQPPRQMVTAYSAASPTKEWRWETADSPYYWGDRTQLVNLGYRPSGAASATVVFRQAGTITFDSLKVLAVPMSDYSSRVTALQSNPMRSIRVSNNRVSGQIDSLKAGLLFLSIPYGPGWRATVDGKPAETLRANTGFTGIVVPAGKHEIELRYETPMLVFGLVASGVALVLSGVLLARARRRRRLESAPESTSIQK